MSFQAESRSANTQKLEFFQIDRLVPSELVRMTSTYTRPTLPLR